jgi:hypothetical protein
MASRTELLKKYYGTENHIEALGLHSRFPTPPPLEQLVKMPIPYKSANYPPLPSVDDIKRSGPQARVCVIDGFVVKKESQRSTLLGKALSKGSLL